MSPRTVAFLFRTVFLLLLLPCGAVYATCTPPAIVQTVTAACPGDPITLDAGEGWVSYEWSTGGTERFMTDSPTEPIWYAVTATNAEGCTATSEYVVNVPVINIDASGPTAFCEGGSVTLTPDAEGTSYLWSNGETTRSITVSSPGSYTVTVGTADGCSVRSRPQSVRYWPFVDVMTSSVEMCDGGVATISLEGGANGPVTITWSDGFVETVDSISHHSRSVSPSATTTYSIVGMSDATCSNTQVYGAATVVVTSDPAPPAGITASAVDTTYGDVVSQENGVVEVCGYPTVELTPALDPSYSYSWSHVYGSSEAIQYVDWPGTYEVTIRTPAGCETISRVTVNFSAPPERPVITASSTEVCAAGGTVTLTAPDADGWSWSNGATTRSVTVTEPGSYTVRVRANLCFSEPSEPVVITSGTSSISTADSLALCPGGSATLTANAGTTWLWSTGATTRSIVVTEPGTYTVTTSVNGCTMQASAPTTVTTLAATRIVTQPASVTVARNTTRQLSVSATAAGTPRYQWYAVNSDGTSTAIANATQSTLTVGPYSRKGTHRFFVRVWSSTCTSSIVTSNTATVTVN